jgi:peptidoglycan/LPS O-acetylase OafA/YrhL
VVVVIVARILDHGSVDSSLRGHAVAALTYIANWWSIAQQNSYQAAFGTESPLNHFWSLAVEEQFYLMFPLALIGTIALLKRRIGLHRLTHIALVGAAVGAVASCALMWILRTPGSDPSRVYLGTDTRSQALFVGIAIACIIRLWPVNSLKAATRTVLTTAALVALAALVGIASTADFRSDWLYTGGFLLIAIATGIIVLALNGHDSIVTKVLSFRWFRTLGLVSYGLYLWHWPIKVFVTGERLHLSDDQAGRIELFAIRVALTAVATALSWYLIEQPFRRKKSTPTEAASTKRASGSFVALGALGVSALIVGVVWFAAAPTARPQADYSSNIAPTISSEKGSKLPISLLWFGDSVAWAMGGGAISFPWPTDYNSPFDPRQIIIWNKGIGECPLLQEQSQSFGIMRDGGKACAGWEAKWRKAAALFPSDAMVWSGALRDTYDVRIDGKWIAFGSPEWVALYEAELDKAAAIATENGVPLIILSQADPKVFPEEKNEDSLTATNIGKFTQLRQIQRNYALAHSSSTISIDINDLMCSSGSCEETTPSGEIIRPDHLHYSSEGARYLAPRVAAEIEDALKQWYSENTN